MTEYCVCCGAEIPEGRMVCPLCIQKAENDDTGEKKPESKSFTVNYGPEEGDKNG